MGVVYSAGATRVFACSDLHTDHKTNWNHLRNTITADKYTKQDVLIVAGDISSSINLIRQTLSFLTSIFSTVFFCPGNNELRLANGDKKHTKDRKPFAHSIEKFHFIIDLCQELGVHTQPLKVNNEIWIVPLFCWYSPRFDAQWDGTHDYQRQWLDFRACDWPDDLNGVGEVSNYFLNINAKSFLNGAKALERFSDAPVITFSHFLPRFELLPPRLLLLHKSLTLVSGDPRLDEQIRKLKAVIHVNGHTHIDHDKKIDGIRYVQNAFGHPAERKAPWKILKRPYAPKLLGQFSTSGQKEGEVGSESEEEEEEMMDGDIGSGQEEEESESEEGETGM